MKFTAVLFKIHRGSVGNSPRFCWKFAAVLLAAGFHRGGPAGLHRGPVGNKNKNKTAITSARWRRLPAAVLTRAHLRVRQPAAGWLAGWCRKKKRRRSGARTTQTTPNHPTQVQSAMHRAVASCRVARRTGALAASARREARARNSGTPRRRMRRRAEERRPTTGKRHAATAAEKRTLHGGRDSHRGPASRRRTPRGAARRGGWVRRVRRVLVGGVRGRARSRNCAVGGRRGRCPFAAATATQVQRSRAARARRAPLAGLWCGELQQVPR